MRQPFDFTEVCFAAPVIVASINRGHTIFANQHAAYECDGDFGTHPDESAPVPRKGEFGVICGIFMWSYVKTWNRELNFKRQRTFEGLAYDYANGVGFQKNPRHFWECHNARPFERVRMWTRTSEGAYRGHLEMMGDGTRTSVPVMEKDNSLTRWPTGTIFITYPRNPELTSEVFLSVGCEIQA